MAGSPPRHINFPRIILFCELSAFILLVAALIDINLIKCGSISFTFFSMRKNSKTLIYTDLTAADFPIQMITEFLSPAWSLIFGSILFLLLAISSTLLNKEKTARPTLLIIVTLAIAIGATIVTSTIKRTNNYLFITMGSNSPSCVLGADTYLLWIAFALMIFATRLN